VNARPGNKDEQSIGASNHKVLRSPRFIPNMYGRQCWRFTSPIQQPAHNFPFVDRQRRDELGQLVRNLLDFRSSNDNRFVFHDFLLKSGLGSNGAKSLRKQQNGVLALPPRKSGDFRA